MNATQLRKAIHALRPGELLLTPIGALPPVPLKTIESAEELPKNPALMWVREILRGDLPGQRETK